MTTTDIINWLSDLQEQLESGPENDATLWAEQLRLCIEARRAVDKLEATFDRQEDEEVGLQRADDAYNAIVNAIEAAHEDHIWAMEPGSAFMDSGYKAEEEARKWENENWDKVEAYEQKRLIPKEY